MYKNARALTFVFLFGEPGPDQDHASCAHIVIVKSIAPFLIPCVVHFKNSHCVSTSNPLQSGDTCIEMADPKATRWSRAFTYLFGPALYPDGVDTTFFVDQDPGSVPDHTKFSFTIRPESNEPGAKLTPDSIRCLATFSNNNNGRPARYNSLENAFRKYLALNPGARTSITRDDIYFLFEEGDGPEPEIRDFVAILDGLKVSIAKAKDVDRKRKLARAIEHITEAEKEVHKPARVKSSKRSDTGGAKSAQASPAPTGAKTDAPKSDPPATKAVSPPSPDETAVPSTQQKAGGGKRRKDALPTTKTSAHPPFEKAVVPPTPQKTEVPQKKKKTASVAQAAKVDDPEDSDSTIHETDYDSHDGKIRPKNKEDAPKKSTTSDPDRSKHQGARKRKLEAVDSPSTQPVTKSDEGAIGMMMQFMQKAMESQTAIMTKFCDSMTLQTDKLFEVVNLAISANPPSHSGAISSEPAPVDMDISEEGDESPLSSAGTPDAPTTVLSAPVLGTRGKSRGPLVLSDDDDDDTPDFVAGEGSDSGEDDEADDSGMDTDEQEEEARRMDEEYRAKRECEDNASEIDSGKEDGYEDDPIPSEEEEDKPFGDDYEEADYDSEYDSCSHSRKVNGNDQNTMHKAPPSKNKKLPVPSSKNASKKATGGNATISVAVKETFAPVNAATSTVEDIINSTKQLRSDDLDLMM